MLNAHRLLSFDICVILGFSNSFQFLEPMLTLIAKEEINDEDLLKCQQVIYTLISFESRNEPLTLPISQNK